MERCSKFIFSSSIQIENNEIEEFKNLKIHGKFQKVTENIDIIEKHLDIKVKEIKSFQKVIKFKTNEVIQIKQTENESCNYRVRFNDKNEDEIRVGEILKIYNVIDQNNVSQIICLITPYKEIFTLYQKLDESFIKLHQEMVPNTLENFIIISFHQILNRVFFISYTPPNNTNYYFKQDNEVVDGNDQIHLIVNL